MKRPLNREVGLPTQAPAARTGAPLLWVALALAAAAFAIYSPVLRYNFVTFDDPEYVTNNPNIAQGFTGAGIAWAFTSGYMFYWHPLTWISHMLDIQLFGQDAGMHHLNSLALHAVNSVLLLWALFRLTGAAWRSAFVAALFAVHPLRVESVAWVAERKDVLSGLFWILTLLAYERYARRKTWKTYVWVLGLFACGLMSKPMVVTLPFALLLLDYWPLERARALSWPAWWPLVREKIPLFALSLLSSIVTFQVQHQVGAVAELDVLPLSLRLQNAVASYAVYLGTTFWPVDLAVLYPFHRLPMSQVAAAFALLAGISAVAWRERRPYLLVGWLWFVGTLVPVIGLVQSGGQAHADRFTYLPLIGIFIALAWGAAELAGAWRIPAVAVKALAGVVLSACLLIARNQVSYWRDSVAMWEHTIAVTTGNYHAHNNLGFYLADQGRVAEAVPHFEEAIRIRPEFSPAHSNLGAALSRQGRSAEAIPHYRAALEADPLNADAHNNLGVALAEQGKREDALGEFLATLQLHPSDANAHANAGVMLAELGRPSEAIEHFNAALRLNPNHALAKQGLGELQRRTQ